MCDLNIPAIGLALDDGIGPNNVALDPILYLNSEIIMGYQNKGWFLLRVGVLLFNSNCKMTRHWSYVG